MGKDDMALEEWLFSINKSRKAYKNIPPTSYKRK